MRSKEGGGGEAQDLSPTEYKKALSEFCFLSFICYVLPLKSLLCKNNRLTERNLDKEEMVCMIKAQLHLIFKILITKLYLMLAVVKRIALSNLKSILLNIYSIHL